MVTRPNTSFSGTNKSRSVSDPMCNPPLRYQSGDNQSHDPFLYNTASFRTSSPEDNVSSFSATYFNCHPPTTNNLFRSSSMIEKACECVPETIETRSSNFKMPHNDTADTKENAPRDNYFRDIELTTEEQKPEESANPAKDHPLKITLKSISSVTKVSPTPKNSPECSRNFKATFSVNGAVDAENSTQSSETCTYC